MSQQDQPEHNPRRSNVGFHPKFSQWSETLVFSPNSATCAISVFFQITAEGQLISIDIKNDEIFHAVHPICQFAPNRRAGCLHAQVIIIHFVADDISRASANDPVEISRQGDMDFAFAELKTRIRTVPKRFRKAEHLHIKTDCSVDVINMKNRNS